MMPLKEALVGLHVFRYSPGRLATRERHLQRRRHGGGDFVLDGKDVGHGAVISLRPDMGVGGNVDELRRDAKPVAGLADAAFQQVGDV